MFKVSTFRLTLSLAPFVVALALSMDVYVPAIPNLTHLFKVSDNIMLLTLSIFMFTAGLMQLAIGPLSDHFGRKHVAYAVTATFALGCILCASAQNSGFLIFSRVIQAIGCCGMMVVGFSIVRDCFKGDKSAAVYSYLNGVVAFSPMFAPFIGSYLDIYFGWRMTFLCLLLVSILAFISLYFFIPETLPRGARVKFSFRGSLHQYKEIILNPIFSIYCLATCFGLAYFYLFCALSPYLIIRNLQVPETQYGFYFCFMGISIAAGSVICSQIVEKSGIYRTCLIGFCLTLVGGLCMAAWFVAFGLQLYGFILPMLLVGLGGTFCMGAGTGGMMTPFAKNTGAAAALGGTLKFLFSSMIGVLVIHDDVASTMPLGLPAILFSLIGLLLFLYQRKTLNNLNRQE
jgi:Bcr/CflA subfamily drug resistance transporter